MQSGTNSRSLTHPSCQQLSHPSIRSNCSDTLHTRIDNTSSLSRPKKPQSMPISGNSPSSREECACARLFDATQWRHQLLYTAVSHQLVFDDLVLHWAQESRFGTLGTMSSSPSIASSHIGSCAPPGSSGCGFSGLTDFGPPPATPRRNDCLNPRTVASHQYCFPLGFM